MHRLNLVLLAGLLTHGLLPGPLLFEKYPDLVYGLFGGLFVCLRKTTAQSRQYSFSRSSAACFFWEAKTQTER